MYSPARASSVRAARSKRCFLPAAERPLRGAPLDAEALSCSRPSGLQNPQEQRSHSRSIEVSSLGLLQICYLSLKPSSISEASAMSPGEHRYEFLSRDLPPVEAVAPGQEESEPSPPSTPLLPLGSSRSSSVPGCSIIHMANTVMFWASASPRAPAGKDNS